MQINSSARVAALAIALAFAPGICTAEEGAQSGPAGAALLSAQEKAQLQKRMDEATTLEQCKAIFADHMKLAEQRAQKKATAANRRMAAAEGGGHSCMKKGSKSGESGGGGCCKGMGQSKDKDGGGGHGGGGHGG